ncbi:MAG: ferritin family protein [Thermodesulfobacteriota bacterium]
MELEEALVTAISYEEKIRDVYRESMEAVSDPLGRKILGLLGDDEQRHVDYLRDQLELWRKTGRIEVEKLESAIPPREIIEEEARRHADTLPDNPHGDEKQILSRALQVEIESSDFYRKMARDMSGEARDLFSGFLEVEDRHIAAVETELDYYSRTGYWMGIKEFDME